MIKNHLYRLKRRLPYLIDQAVSPFVDPRSGIVITGFWRSGTTWLERWIADLLHAKTIFEPLEVDVRKQYFLQEESYLPSQTDIYLKAHMPFAETKILPSNTMYRLLEDALRGKVPGKRVRINRRGIADSFRRRVVVKHVRGQLAVYGFYQTFSTPILHIYRDPRAVVASLIRKDWGGDWMHQLSLRSQLLEPQDGRCTHFEAWTDDMDYFDRQPWWERAVAYWALTENYLRSCASRFQFPLQFLNYEDLTGGGTDVLVSALASLGVSIPNKALETNPLQSSPTTDEGRRDADREVRVSGWKKELSAQMADRTVEIVNRFGCTFFSA